MAESWTRGPLSVGPELSYSDRQVLGPDGRPIGCAYAASELGVDATAAEKATALANAQAWSATPDLVLALREISASISLYAAQYRDHDGTLAAVLDRAGAALARATGGEL